MDRAEPEALAAFPPLSWSWMPTLYSADYAKLSKVSGIVDVPNP